MHGNEPGEPNSKFLNVTHPKYSSTEPVGSHDLSHGCLTVINQSQNIFSQMRDIHVGGPMSIQRTAGQQIETQPNT